MTIKLNSLDRWKTLESGAVINFNGAEGVERRVRIRFNCEEETTLYLEDANGPRFLTGVGIGVTELEFGATGNFAVYPPSGSATVQYQTAEDEPTHAVIVDPVIFTKIANRRHRNPELEEMMMRMEMNIQRRYAQQAGEMQAALDRRIREIENGRATEQVQSNAPGTAASVGSGEVPAQEPKQPGTGKVEGSADPSEPKSGATGASSASGGKS